MTLSNSLPMLRYAIVGCIVLFCCTPLSVSAASFEVNSYVHGFANPISIAVAADGSYIVGTGYGFEIFDSAGTQTLFIPPFEHFFATTYDINNNALYAVTSTQLVKYSLTGTLLQSWSLSTLGVSQPKGVWIYNNKIYISQNAPPGGIVAFDLTTMVAQGSYTNAAVGSSVYSPFVDNTGIYLADSTNRKVHRWSADGTYEQGYTTSTPALDNPQAVYVDAAGNLYIADKWNNRIVKLNNAGVQQQEWTVPGGNPLFVPSAVYVTPAGDVLATDWQSGRVYRWNNAGVLQQTVQKASPYQEFDGPIMAIAVDDTNGDIYWSLGYGKIMRYRPTNGALTTLATISQPTSSVNLWLTGLAFEPVTRDLFAIDTNSGALYRISQSGVYVQVTLTSGKISWPTDLELGNNALYVADVGGQRVAKFALDGTFQSYVISGQFVTEIAVNNAGDIYYVDQTSTNVIRVDADGVQQQTFSTVPPMTSIGGMYVDRTTNELFVSDSPASGSRISQFDASGAVINTFTSSPSMPDFGSHTAFGDVVLSQDSLYATSMMYNNFYTFAATDDVGSVTGDPQFVGFQQQTFQVHGIPDAYFCLVSAPHMFVNAEFIYLDLARQESYHGCTYSHTACWTHPGTYLGGIGIGLLRHRIVVRPGPASHGLGSVVINDVEIPIPTTYARGYHNNSAVVAASQELKHGLYQLEQVGMVVDSTHSEQHWHFVVKSANLTEMYRITITRDHVTIHTSELTLRFVNSDRFLNLEMETPGGSRLHQMIHLARHHPIDLSRYSTVASYEKKHHDVTSHPHQSSLLPYNVHLYSMHGLVGQTWRLISYADQHPYEGMIEDYQVSGLLSFDMPYSLYQADI